jgi:hypothetical protein
MESHREKLEWARKQTDLLNADIRAFVEGDAYGTVMQFDPQTKKLTIRFKVTATFPPDWSLRIGDILHNQRSALDALAYALAFKHSGKPTDKEARPIQFPICESPNDFKSGLWRLVRLSPSAIDAIESIQPYKRRKPGAIHELTALGDLNNIDKHRHLVPCYTAGNGRIVLQLEPLRGIHSIKAGPPVTVRFNGRLENDAVLGVVDVPSGVDPVLDIAKHAKMAVDVSLDEPAAGNAGIASVLHLIDRDIRQVVFPTLEKCL